MTAKPVNQRIRINLLRAAFLLALPLLLFVTPAVGYGTFGHEFIETIGILILLAGVLGRFWSILYVGGMKNKVVMQDGPYSITRNPLYFFSTVAAFGIGLMMGALFFAVLLGGLVGAILYVTGLKERRFLEAEFGPAYAEYAARVPFFLPDPRLFRTASEATVSAATLRTNLFDALVFLSFIPIVEALDWIKADFGWHLFSVW